MFCCFLFCFFCVFFSLFCFCFLFNTRQYCYVSVFSLCIEKCNILHDSQYGFRKKRSTEHAILDIINEIETNMDKKLYSCGVFIDLQKAFDTVNHSILLRKLNHYGVRGIINDWFASYLVGRQQTTQIGPKNISKKEVVLSGVPQGSVLGPLLF